MYDVASGGFGIRVSKCRPCIVCGSSGSDEWDDGWGDGINDGVKKELVLPGPKMKSWVW